MSMASQHIAQGNQDLSDRTEQSAGSLQQAVTQVAQIGIQVQQGADAAQQASELASHASVVAARGGAAVHRVVSTMDEINQASRRIGDIIGVIDGIAFQTNILALNAAVEAARAGEQGRGFAVVAGEVRTLAGRSAEAAREIKALVGTSVAKVDVGGQYVRDAGTTMDEIVASVGRVQSIIELITGAAQAQRAGIEQVNQTVLELDRNTQQNAALVEQTAAAAQQVLQQTRVLCSTVGVFRTEG
jgi:methyl-accepting chemotaxis protein